MKRAAKPIKLNRQVQRFFEINALADYFATCDCEEEALKNFNTNKEIKDVSKY